MTTKAKMAVGTLLAGLSTAGGSWAAVAAPAQPAESVSCAGTVINFQCIDDPCDIGQTCCACPDD